MTAKPPPKEGPELSGPMFPVSLSVQLPRLLSRVRLLPESAERDRTEQGILFSIAHWDQYNNEHKKLHVLGYSLFVGELEHQARLDNLLEANASRREGNARGGKNKRAPEWHERCISYAGSLLATGKQRHELSGILAERFKRDRTSIDRVLKKAGVK